MKSWNQNIELVFCPASERVSGTLNNIKYHNQDYYQLVRKHLIKYQLKNGVDELLYLMAWMEKMAIVRANKIICALMSDERGNV